MPSGVDTAACPTILSVACGGDRRVHGCCLAAPRPARRPTSRDVLASSVTTLGLGNHEARRFPWPTTPDASRLFLSTRAAVPAAWCCLRSGLSWSETGPEAVNGPLLVVMRNRGSTAGSLVPGSRDPGAYRRRLTGGCMPCAAPLRRPCRLLAAGLRPLWSGWPGHLIAAAGCRWRRSRFCVVPGPRGSGGWPIAGGPGLDSARSPDRGG